MTDVAAGGVSGGAVAFVHGTYKVERYKESFHVLPCGDLLLTGGDLVYICHSSFADKLLQELVEEVIGDHEMMIAQQSHST
ncbi:hypothetical protein C5167_049818 [Papaver somniferum]|uniref:Uncharacterized protein n=1 Tax=Papaver somniferum TaxID=3469 RepID=A0A4Y7KPS0_PAPSO|nr:hypothetical protein C5167_049818 [Papaver somniferum]